jgi:AraC-like DNA-binding protein
VDNHDTVSREKLTAWCHPLARAAHARLFPSLCWEALPTRITSLASAIVTESENRRTTLTLSPVRFDDLPSLAQEGWIRPLDAWFTPEQLAIYAPQAMALATVNGRLYAIPDDITPFVFFVRADLLRRLKMPPPCTWEAFEALAAALADRRQSLTMCAGGERFRLGFMLALLGSNGVVPADNVRLLRDAHRATEAYDWLRRLAVARRLMSLDEITHLREASVRTAITQRAAAGFGWLSSFAHLPAAVLRRFVFLPFPRGPSLPPGTGPAVPMKGSGWCIPWSKMPPDEAIRVLHDIHAPGTRRAVGGTERFPYATVRSRWDDPAVRRRFPLYGHAAGLIDGTEAMLSGGLPHYRRLDVTFRNALLDGLDGQGWLDDYSDRQGLRSKWGQPPPIQSVLRAVESRLGQARGIGDIARSIGLHPVKLRHLLRQELNEQGGAYFRKRRLEAARTLLAAGGMDVKQVAAQVGYRNASAFSRAYRQCYGYMPSAEGKG